MTEKILVVDDSSDNRALLRRILEKSGYEALEAANGEEAIDRTLEALPDLILLDILMPKRDGFEACRLLKSDDRTASIPIIFLSALGESRDKIKGLEAGGADYITKPFDRGEILARVRTQLKISRLTRELLAANRELMEKQRRLDEDMKAAALIQQSLLPTFLPDIESFQFAWKFLPSERIGGDIFDVFLLDEHHLGVYMLDVSGHGVPAALITVSVSQTLDAHLNVIPKKKTERPRYDSIRSPGEVLADLERGYPLERFEKHFTIVYAVISVSDGRVVYSSAGHPPPILIRRDGSLELLEAGGAVIGLGGALPFEEGEASMAPGDKLVFYTDGVIDYSDARGQFYGMERFQQKLQELGRQSIRDMTAGVARDLEEFGVGATRQDDVSILGIAYKG
jgi:sigma-B regulation protein RsbU (phosphoserine phosphatase)